MDDAFIDAYFAIDTDNSGSITIKELEEYQRKNKLDKSFVQKWKNLFDKRSTGTISLETFCDVLGLEMAKVKEDHGSKFCGQLSDDCEVISSDMTMESQIKIFEIILKEMKKERANKDLGKAIKQALDESYGRIWHVVMVQGQYWSFYSHEPEYSFIFRYKPKNLIFLLWRTPGN